MLTLKIQKKALEKGFSLKDASIFNVQFKGPRPIFIDTLSFESYQQDSPWVSFSQFCRHFLYPLFLMSNLDLRLNNLFRIWLDGIPLELAESLLSKKKRFSLNYWLYVKLPFLAQKKYQHRKQKIHATMSQKKLFQLLDNMGHMLQGLSLPQAETEWGEYYTFTNYSDEAFQHKKDLVEKFIDQVKPASIWDLGANNGYFSRCASNRDIPTVAFDIDPIAVEKLYTHAKEKEEDFILPLLLDLTNPSPDLGWAHKERKSLAKRGPVDLCMALALVHHLAIGNNIPLGSIASYFASLCRFLVIEFVPKGDSQVDKLLLHRKDVFDTYTQSDFEKQFSEYFMLVSQEAVKNSIRVLYLWKRK